jgi:CubicO group peptidase (beta-lactamase class C family)
VGSSAGSRWPKEGVGHLGFTGTSLWLDPPRGRAVVLLSNRVEPTRKNERIKIFRPLLHDAVLDALDGR